MAPILSHADAARRRRMRIHVGVITHLYFCQGILQGCLQLAPLLLLQRYPQMPAAWQATLGLPLGAFVLKCLWAPLVDRVYVPCAVPLHAKFVTSSWQRCRAVLHRRVQWIVVLQLLLLVIVVVVAEQPGLDAVLRADTVQMNTAQLTTILFVLCTVAFASATQDVAVDAWAIEGLPESKAPIAGTMQLFGVVGGILLTNLYVQAQSRYPLVCSATNFFSLVAVLLAVSIPLAVYLAVLERAAPVVAATEAITPKSSAATNTPLSLLASLRLLFVSRGTREIVVLYMTRNWAVGSEVLVGSRLVSLGLVSATMWSRYRVYGTVVQLVLGSLTATRLLARVPAARVCRLVAAAHAGVAAVSTLLFIALASPKAASWYGPRIVLPLSLLLSSMVAYVYVAGMTLASSVAHRFPNDAGTVLTLLAAVSNLGYTLPHTGCMFLASMVVSITSTVFQRDTRYGVQKHLGTNTTAALSEVAVAPLWMLKLDVIVCSLVFFTVGMWMFYRFVIPASLTLERYEEARKAAKIDDDNGGTDSSAVLVGLSETT